MFRIPPIQAGSTQGMTRANPPDPVVLLGADQQHIVTRRSCAARGAVRHHRPPAAPRRALAAGAAPGDLPADRAADRPSAAARRTGVREPEGAAPQAGEVLLTGDAVLADAGLPSAGHPADLGRVDVPIPGQRRVGNRAFVRVHRAAGPLPGGFERDDGLWSTTVARALADLAPGETGQRRFRALCAEAVQRRHCELGELLDHLLARPGALGLPQVARVVEDLTAGVRSVVEGEARELLAHAGLPEPLWNPVLFRDGRFLAVPDAYWPHACVALEIDSRAWHPRPADHERGRARANRLTAAGLPVVRTTPIQLRRDPTPVLHELTALLTTGPHGPHLRITWRRAR